MSADGPAPPGGPQRHPPGMTPGLPHALLLFSVSASVLAYEILLMRLLSIGLWHHFAYMVISLALLGFGAAGSLLFLVFERIKRRLEQWLVLFAGAAAVSFPLAFSLSQRTGLDPLNLVWQPAEWVKMLFTYLIMAVPFLLAGLIVGMLLTASREKAHLLYAADLAGAGSGALAVVPLLYVGPPWVLLPGLGGLILSGAAWCALRRGPRVQGALTILMAAGLVAASYLLLPPIPRVHHTKALPMTLSFPDARIEAERVGPLGMIHVVGSGLIREVPGLSLNFGLGDKEKAALPPQKAIFVDGEISGAITRYHGRPEEPAHLDFTTGALPYHVRRPGRVLVLGAGGGTDVLLGLRHGAAQITALEANRQIADLMTGPFAEFSGRLYQAPGVRLLSREARQYLHATGERFDLIQLSLLDSFANSAGGLHSAEESYLYTREAFRLYLSRLTDSGVLAVTRWLKLPPRDSLKILATALSALREISLSDRPDRHILFIRSWKTATILVSRSPFGPEEIADAAAFCRRRSFDLAYYAGMGPETANQYDILAEPYYFQGARALSGPEAEAFLKGYIFDISPASDDRPYFSHFFRWGKAPDLFRHLRREWLPLIDLGYVFVVATLAQALIAAAALILLPLLFLRRVRRKAERAGPGPKGSDILKVLVYFGGIGLAFMFLEMALLPRFTLLLSHPIYSAAAVLSSILLFAGFGSLCVRRIQGRFSWFLWLFLAGVSLWACLQLLAGDRLFAWALARPFWARLALSVSLIAILSFFLGWPFPSGLRLLMGKFPGLAPWAWGINGCASVIGAVLGKALAMDAGFRLLVLGACLLYLLATATFYSLFNSRDL